MEYTDINSENYRLRYVECMNKSFHHSEMITKIDEAIEKLKANNEMMLVDLYKNARRKHEDKAFFFAQRSTEWINRYCHHECVIRRQYI